MKEASQFMKRYNTTVILCLPLGCLRHTTYDKYPYFGGPENLDAIQEAFDVSL